MFISYAQNFEDVMLWRALKHVKKGFYIDVGANDPVMNSITKAFYDRGWQGINIEPISSHFYNLKNMRIRDINLHCAVGEKEEETFIWECAVGDWATMEKSVIKDSISNGMSGIYHRIHQRTLENICEEYATGEIHFLKIDVEGFEKSVLSGANFEKFRPWIVIVATTTLTSELKDYQELDFILVSANYQCHYVDGLNRFYISKEQSKLIPAFKYPPNVFDNFISARVKELEERLDKAHDQIRLGEINSTELKNVYQSRSWKITKPIRILFHCVYQLSILFQEQLHFIKNILIALVFKVLRMINKFPSIEKAILILITKLGLYDKIRAVYKRKKVVSHEFSYGLINYRFSYLTPRSFMIYSDLKIAFAKMKKENT